MLEDNAAMPKRPSKLKPTRRAGKPSGSGGRDRAVTGVNASSSRNDRRQKTKHDDTPGQRKPKQRPLHEPPLEPAASVSDQVVQPVLAPKDLTPATAQQQAEELLEKLAGVAFGYYQAALDDMWVHRRAAHIDLLYTARILQAVARANDGDDGVWLETQARRAKDYLDEHRDDPRPPDARSRPVLSYERPEAANHMKRFVVQKLQNFSVDGRVPYHLSSKVSDLIAEVMVGNLVGGGAVELAWEFLPELRQDLGDDASTRAHVAHEVSRIIKNAEPYEFEATAKAVVRRVLRELGYKSTKGLFDFARKAEALQDAGPRQRRSVRATKDADQAAACTQATAETSDSTPPSERNA
ncbi:hypothetical protein [Sorangium sp. So ce693]|uniref:hypothetical protein n=1 Tax=Sorangium sp. So ce693 TaxID=3133318 RepID=UPI003F5DC9AC